MPRSSSARYRLDSGPRLPAWVAVLVTLGTMVLGLVPARAGFGFDDPLIPYFGSWQAWPGTNEPPAVGLSWKDVGYLDRAWQAVTVPLALDSFGLQDNPWLRGMSGNYSTLFLRRLFTVEDPKKYDSVHLSGYVQGGCVVSLNGVDVLRTLVPADPLSLTQIALPPTEREPGSMDLQVPTTLVHAGTNVLAVRLLNTALRSSKLYFGVTLDGAVDRIPPVVDRVLPESDTVRNVLGEIEVVFSEMVAGVDASDLLANGVPATAVTEVSPGDYLFTLPPLGKGTVTLGFGPGHGITDRSSASNAFQPKGPWSYYLDPGARLEAIRVTEFLADNVRGLRDDDGNREDWIELRNFGAEAAPLEGWGLGLDSSGAGRWVFPSRMLSPGAHLVVFASGKNRRDPARVLHTDFKLPKAGGSLLLFKPDGTVAGGFNPYPPQLPDKSYGTVVGITGAQGYFVTPTPGELNSTGGAGFAGEVQFSEASRSFAGTLTLKLSLAAPDPKVVIRYTLDQSEPTPDSPAYSEPMAITNVAIVRARAFSVGLLPGPVRTESYFPAAPDLKAFTSTLPVVVVNDFGGGRPPLGYRIPSYLHVFEPAADGLTRLDSAPTLTTRAGIAARGSSTAGNPKVNLRVEFWDEADADRKLPFLGLPAEADWILYAPGGFDPALINNAFAHQLSRNLGRYSSRTRFVELFLVTDSATALAQAQYGGVYLVEERIELGKNRVDLDRVAPGATAAPDITGGYLFKIDRASGSEGAVTTTRETVLVVEPNAAELTPPQQSWLQSYFKRFESALYGVNFKDPVLGYAPFIDRASWIDHHLINVLLFNVDALRLSAYFSLPREGVLTYGPLWDFDRAMRSTDGRDLYPRVWRSGVDDRGTDYFNYPIWAKLFRDPDFYQAYTDRYQELRHRAFSLPALMELVDLQVSQVSEAQPRDARRWGDHTRGGYVREIRDLKLWLSNRLDFIDGQMVRQPGVRTNGAGQMAGVEFEAASGTTVYYTTDGSDPRGSGGDLAPNALIASGALQFATNAMVVARSRSALPVGVTGLNNPPLASFWSAPVRVSLAPESPPLRCTEIHFNPGRDTVAGDEQELEFVEFANVSDSAVDLRGWKLLGGIAFDWPTDAPVVFPVGARIVLARNPQLLRARTPGLPSVVGPYSGHLSNSGDSLELQDALGIPRLRLTYSDTWQPDADGGGYSLVPVYEGPAGESSDPGAAWTRSALVGGSPGALDAASVPDLAPTLVIEGAQVVLGFTGARNRVYTLWAKSGPTPAESWSPVGTVTAPTGVARLEWRSGVSGARRFYRVTTP